MFDKIIAYSIKHKFIVGILVVALIGVGTYAMRTLPIDALPDITNNQVQVITTSPSLATQEVELFITYPIELAIKSIPGIIELRSISRFGLSVITVVFEEDVDQYWARAQITERLKEAERQIPKSFGTPELAPISTGLGEIFQYTVTPAEGFEDKYSTMDLRSIQDWIIIPQLIGTKGVAEVNTLGGILKEYEVSVNPDKLKSMGVTMAEIFSALEVNNENTGGAYIDKKPYAYYIRSIGMINSLKDVSNIVIKVNNEIPVLIRDVADVNFGNSIRYGATTRNGNGEVVNGMVMMLKGENSAEIVSLVKDRIEKIKTTLPEGIDINPYLDRSKLVDRAISTVRTNLLEGALIVIFILVILIGNWRAGLIVASVIPLSLLFAMSMMRLFGVSGNLMSLGAIDFGLIVDGAVIIVEAIVHRLQSKPAGTVLTSKQMDQEVYGAASKIRTSAAYGEIIILIVYLPILALVGIEGKMFAPMAQTVSFAILGAFILSLTYVPMVSSLFLSKKLNNKKTFSDKIIASIQSIYTPVLDFAMNIKKTVLFLTVILFGISLWIFSTLGGEFIPTLSEGDIATHIIIPPGSSLEQEIETTTKAEKLLLDNFPEIEQIVSKIGSAEVPTDPMPMEVADAMVILKDKSEWTSAGSKEEMFEKMEEVLNQLPGVTTEFSQPIQMRFNELMTGIRTDVGIKFFGEDIDRLVAIGDEVVNLINAVEGVEDIRAEQVSGLPQINIQYDKDKIALYGLNIKDLNQIVNMGFAGAAAGVVYEGEKRYNLVVRLAESFRKDITNIQNLYVPLPSGNQIPLSQIANVRLERGPAQISRENGKRRIIVGFNVRGRDIESAVTEIQEVLASKLTLPVGYYTEFSGQFENLRRAKNRLSIAVPIALILIFILLHFTFYSVKQSLLIFTAIPFSAIGGVFALWMRDMPFSISAGIGFIALFGVAVLNGIVLISYFNQLKSEGMKDIMERIKVGTAVRLRPVIMTAAVASLGFLPMALSTSAGAEVQKPLATVVIGGLITATLLTLIILPILYYYLEKLSVGKSKIPTMLIIGILTTIGFNTNAQVTSVAQAIEIGLTNNKSIQASFHETAKAKQLIDGAYQIPKTEFGASIGQINTNALDYNFTISQSFNPFLKSVKKELARDQFRKTELQHELNKQDLILQLRNTWDLMLYKMERLRLADELIERWRLFAQYASKKQAVGDSNLIENTTAEIKLNELIHKRLKLQSEVDEIQTKIQSLLYEEVDIAPDNAVYEQIELTDLLIESDGTSHPMLLIAQQEIKIAESRQNVFKGERKPDFAIGYFLQSIRGAQEIDGIVTNYDGTPRFQGINLKLSLPIFSKNYSTKIKAAETEKIIQQANFEQQSKNIENYILGLVKRITTLQTTLRYYKTEGLVNADRIETSAQMAYESGDISYLEYIQALNIKTELKEAYLGSVHEFNQASNQFLYLKNQ